MKIRILTVFLAFFMVSIAFAQESLNAYKYVIVPNKYEFFKEADKYQLNSLTAFLFDKQGFITVVEGTPYPDELNKNRCLALEADVEKTSKVFKTLLTIVLKDCTGKVVFTSKAGKSGEKEYQKAYTMALRDAFTSIEKLRYKYVADTSVSE